MQSTTADTTQSSGAAALERLPPELLLRILDELPPQSIVHLSATSSNLRSIARSDIVWKAIVQSLLAQTKAPEQEDGSEPISKADGEGDYYWKQAAFLLPNSQHLGWWISSTPYTSRLIRLTTTSDAGSHSTTTIQAHQLTPTNAYALPGTPPPPLPLGAVLDPTRTAYSVPRRGAGSINPDAGLSVDILEPHYHFLPLFNITAHSGALLSSTPYSALAPSSAFGSTLKLRLQTVEREVKNGQKEEEEQTPEQRRRSEADAMYSLFTGRPPVNPWPTADLVGLPSEGSHGAFRGVMEWMTERGVERPVLNPSKEGATSSSSTLGFVSGFSLQIRRTTTNAISLPGSYPHPSPPTLPNVEDDVPRRRQRGIGPNGGPAVLWDGREDDPQARPDVATLRAHVEEDGPGGFAFHIPRIPTQRVATPEEQDAGGEEVVRTDREEFYPIKPPSRPLSFDNPPPPLVDGEVSAASLEGLWVGTYGGHGLEFGYLSVKLTLMESSVEGQATWSRVVDFVKVTGDSNVPSGQISWTAVLPPLLLSPSSSPPTSLGPLPSIPSSTLLLWSTYDPASSPTSSVPRWETGSVAGAGRVALSGFVSPGWTGAVVTFVRSIVRFEREREGEEGVEVKEGESVEEIRVRWSELGKVGVFRRVRV